MKFLLLSATLLLVSCTPSAILLLEPGQSPPGRPRPAPPASPQPAETSPTQPGPSGDDLGLLEPSSLTEMPDEREMRPTVEPADDRPVIATPPTDAE